MDVVKKGTKFSILFGLLGQSLLTGLVAGYITYFGTDIVGVSALAMGNILLISRIFDGVTDLMMGAVIDKTKSKKGKARPWIFRAMIPFALFTILLFALPVNFGAGAKIVWIFVMYNLYAIAYTALGCAMNTLNIRLTRNEKEINSLSTFMMFGMILGNVVINASAVGILTALSGGSSNYTQSAFVIMAIILSVVSLLIAMPFALGISNKIGKRKASLIGLCCTMIGFALMFLNIYNLPIFILGLVIKGICFAPVQGAGNAFVADSALYGEWKFGVKSEGMAYSAISFANKVSSGLSGVLVGWVLGLTGYVANAATQTPAATNGIIFLYIGVTFICTVVQIIIFALYNLDGKMPEIRNALAVKNTEK